MDWKEIVSAAAGIGIIFPGFSAAWTFYEKAKDSIQIRRKARQEEVLRLQASLREVHATFDAIIDYESDLDEHLRINNLAFQPEEVVTRSNVDRVFDHLRDVYRSICLGLIDKDDLGPWVYWVYRVQMRVPVLRYARACGYGVFLNELYNLIESSPELADLKKNCPWL